MEPPAGQQTKRLSLRPEWRDNRLSFVASIKPLPATEGTGSPLPSTMDSPLTQQNRPEVFEPKVVGLYRRLFREVDDEEKPEGFWATLFLLRPDLPRLRQVLEDTDVDFLLQMQHQSQQLLVQSIAALKIGHAPADEHALDTLAVFFSVILAKRYNTSAEVIEIVAGLDSVDAVFTELVASLDNIIRSESKTTMLRTKAVRAAMAIVSGGYQTALVSYFVNRDFFPGLMRLVQHEESEGQNTEALLLTGLLANYGKFESHNQYRIRFADFVNDAAVTRIVESISSTCDFLRARYIAIQDDTPATWSVAGTLSYVGLGSLAGAKPAPPTLTEEQQRELFTEQPGSETATLLTMYDFVQSNKLFCNRFVSQPAQDKTETTPFTTFISFSSYLYQHAYRSLRASSYAYLTLLTLLILIEDPTIAKLLCDTTAPVRLCRQRPPFLPLPKPDRPYAAAILDLLTDGINHNLRKRLDVAFYIQSLTVLNRLISYLSKIRTKLSYHWSELWRTLLSLVRFLNQYADDIRSSLGSQDLVGAVVEVLALALTSGEAFLPDASAYDDLFYKLVESGEALTKLRDTYNLAKADDKKQSAINTLIGVSQHYKELIDSHRAKKEHLSPREIDKIIRQGYDTLSIETRDGVAEQVKIFREADHKSELKKIIRVVVADAVVVLDREHSAT
ncbi:hypothetical protein LTR78_005082 [Recurvomyces mirabilis]|uniref:Armadillo-like helical domain-containing protein n=1 Tax=Recurvomyces mirabilis TaxID=574656 RepID=A0AAE1C1Y8_9PEZI|nr:hypothetical protein LTR78_005082 [Recurvomyces mirabilis]KAK5158301.1 hypothetical protein LTS14_003319 [Recurvomyces mirabilis]